VLICESKLLLMQLVLPDRSLWCTIGGGVKHGESLEDAVRREVLEETGLGGRDIKWHGPIWTGEHVLARNGVPMLHRETYFLGSANTTRIDSSRLTASELKVVRRFKWWSRDELRTTAEKIVPPAMLWKIAAILEGTLPSGPKALDPSG